MGKSANRCSQAVALIDARKCSVFRFFRYYIAVAGTPLGLKTLFFFGLRVESGYEADGTMYIYLHLALKSEISNPKFM